MGTPMYVPQTLEQKIAQAMQRNNVIFESSETQDKLIAELVNIFNHSIKTE